MLTLIFLTRTRISPLSFESHTCAYAVGHFKRNRKQNYEEIHMGWGILNSVQTSIHAPLEGTPCIAARSHITAATISTRWARVTTPLPGSRLGSSTHDLSPTDQLKAIREDERTISNREGGGLWAAMKRTFNHNRKDRKMKSAHLLRH
jgi:hypothetical protein